MRIHSKLRIGGDVPEVEETPRDSGFFKDSYIGGYDIFLDDKQVMFCDHRMSSYTAYWIASAGAPAAFTAALAAYAPIAYLIGQATVSVGSNNPLGAVDQVPLREARDMDKILRDKDFTDFELSIIHGGGKDDIFGTETSFRYDSGGRMAHFSSPFAFPDVVMDYFLKTTRFPKRAEAAMYAEIEKILSTDGLYKPLEPPAQEE
ncbi:MAG TPA: hypothetical protein VJI12_00920 [archaeon]|nr:hypothetical protein [archaeon]